MTRPPMPALGEVAWGNQVTNAVYDVSDRLDQEVVARVNGDASGGGGGGSGALILDTDDPVPLGTLSGTIIARVAGTVPAPVVDITVLTGSGNETEGGSGGTLDFTVAVPVNRAVGQLVVLLLASQSSDFTGTDWVLPAGWTQHWGATVGRRQAIYSYPITNSSALSALGSSFTVTPHSSIAGGRLAWAAFLITGADLANPWAGKGSTVVSGTNTDITLTAFTATASPCAQLTFIESQTSTGVPVPNVIESGMADVVAYNYQLPSTGAYTGIWASWKRSSTANLPAVVCSTVQAASSGLVGTQFAIKQVP